MDIYGKRGLYRVTWSQAGWSFGEPIVRFRKKMWLLPFYRWVKVWEGDAIAFETARKMHRPDLHEWFVKAVQQYESRLESFNQ